MSLKEKKRFGYIDSNLADRLRLSKPEEVINMMNALIAYQKNPNTGRSWCPDIFVHIANLDLRKDPDTAAKLSGLLVEFLLLTWRKHRPESYDAWKELHAVNEDGVIKESFRVLHEMFPGDVNKKIRTFRFVMCLPFMLYVPHNEITFSEMMDCMMEYSYDTRSREVEAVDAVECMDKTLEDVLSSPTTEIWIFKSGTEGMDKLVSWVHKANYLENAFYCYTNWIGADTLGEDWSTRQRFNTIDELETAILNKVHELKTIEIPNVQLLVDAIERNRAKNKEGQVAKKIKVDESE